MVYGSSLGAFVTVTFGVHFWVLVGFGVVRRVVTGLRVVITTRLVVVGGFVTTGPSIRPALGFTPLSEHFEVSFQGVFDLDSPQNALQ